MNARAVLRVHTSARWAALIALCIASAARADWGLSLYTGTSDTLNGDLRIRQAGTNSDAVFKGVHWAAGTYHQAPYYGVRVSYFRGHSARWGATFDYTHYKMYAETEHALPVYGVWNGMPINTVAPMNARVQGFEMAHGVNLTAMNVQYRWVAGDAGDIDSDSGERALNAASRWEPHVGIGLASYWPHSQGIIDDQSVYLHNQFGGLGAQIYGGTEYRLSNHWSLLFDTKYNYARIDIDLDPETRVETTVNTLHVLYGLTFHF